MAYLNQNSSPVVNTSKLSLSTWFRMPSVGGMPINSNPQSLLNFGTQAQNNLKASCIRWTSSSGNWRLDCFFFGGGRNAGFPPPPIFGMSNRFLSTPTPTIGNQTYDVWHHLAMGYDGSDLSGGGPFHGLSPNPIFTVMLDGAALPGTASASSPASLPWSDPLEPGVVENNALYINGNPVGFPVSANLYEPLPPVGLRQMFTEIIDFADTQIWFGTYIDFSVAGNFSKFAIERDGRLYPVGGTAAADTFGTPDLWFVRDTVSGTRFEANLGTGGDFEVTGTPPVDVSPGPEEGVEIPVP